MWKWFITAVVVFQLVGCGKNEAIRTAGGPLPSPGVPTNGGPYPSNPYGPYSPMTPPAAPFYPYGGGGFGNGYFQPGMPMGYGPQFYPWMPIYVFYQQNVILQPIFITMWSGWQNYAYLNRIPVYDFTVFWYTYCPQVMSPQLYQYFGNQFYNWMTPTAYFSPSYSPQLFWQNYVGMPFTYSCAAGCY